MHDYMTVWEHPTYHHVCYPITFCSAFLPALVFIQRSTTNQMQLLFADQSALTAATTSLGSAHQDLYKRQLLDSNHQIISELQSVTSDIQWHSASQHAWSRATSLRRRRHYIAPGMAASALQWSCTTHRATGRLDLPVAIPHTLGNWRTCYMPSLQCPRSKTRQLASCCTAARQHPATAACDQATSACG
jgi:hypothetical protein